MTDGPVRRLILRSDAASLRTGACRELREACAARRPVWLVGETRRAMDDLAHLAAGEGPLFAVHRASSLQWAAAMGAEATFASDLTRIAMIRKALDQLELVELAPLAWMRGLAPSLAATFADLRAHGITPDDLARAAVAEPRIDELARIYSDHRRRLEAEGLVDAVSVYETAVPTGDMRAVLVDMALEGAVAWDFLARVAARAAEVRVLLRASDPRVERWSELLGVEPEETGQPGPEPAIEWFNSHSEHQEATEIARRIQASELPYDRIAVVARQPRQQMALQAAFRAAQIPHYAARGMRRPDPRGRAFLALLHCAEENLSAERFAEYLSFGQVPPHDADGSVEPVPVPWVSADDPFQLGFVTYDATERKADSDGGLDVVDRWEHWLVEAAVVGSRDRWERRLRGLIRELEIQLEQDPTHEARRQADVQSLRRLRGFAMPLIDRLDGWSRQRRRWGEWLEELEALATAAIADPAPVLAVLAELRPLSAVGPVACTDVRRVLEGRLTDLRIEPQGARYGQVFVGTPDEVRGRSFELTFVPGLAEGQFPPPNPPDPLLAEAVRGRLHPELPRLPRQRRIERDRLNAALASAPRVLLSYPRVDPRRERSQIPSQYMLECLQRGLGRVPTARDLARPEPGHRSFGPAWWVPVDPLRAVHSAEYDVAVAAEQASLPAEARPGGLRYLSDDPGGCAMRSLRARWARWSPQRSVYDGAVFPKEVAPPALSDRAWSATALQAFAECPYKFWLHGVMRFRPRPPVLAPQQLDPLTRGAIYHAIQQALFRRCGSALPTYEEVGLVWREQADRHAELLAPAVPPVFEREMVRLRTDLHGWYRALRREGQDYVPRHAELAFGIEVKPTEHDPASRATPVQLLSVPDLKVRGAIDLVEVAPDGQVRVTDFKTSRRPQYVLRVGRGRVLQPVLYALAASKLLDQTVGTGRLAYATVAAGFQRVDVPVDADAVAALRTVVEEIDRHLSSGNLPAAPESGACRWCDFRAHCGPREAQRAALKQPELTGLRRVRRLP